MAKRAISDVEVSTAVRVDAYAVISRAVDEGVVAGWRRAHKHFDVDEGHRPEVGYICDQIAEAVMSNLCEVLRFPD